MDEIIMRRLKHLQWLEENHEKDFQERLGVDTAEAEKRREEVADALSADWNGKRLTSIAPVPPRALPSGWRKEHWKTQQAIASDYAGVKAANKYEAVKALAAYEARLEGGEAA